MPAPLLAVVGLKREATLISGPGVEVLVGGGVSSALRSALQARLAEGTFRAVVSVGLAGALSPQLQVGDWLAADEVRSGDRRWRSDSQLAAELRAGLNTLAPGHVRCGALAASEVMVVDTQAKAALHALSQALAVDMESHVAAELAAEHGLPFAAARVVSDAASHALPPAAQAGMKKDGRMDILAVLANLARDPRQLPALIRTGREAEVAFRALKLLGRHDLLGRLGVGDADLGQLLLDVV